MFLVMGTQFVVCDLCVCVIRTYPLLRPLSTGSGVRNGDAVVEIKHMSTLFLCKHTCVYTVDTNPSQILESGASLSVVEYETNNTFFADMWKSDTLVAYYFSSTSRILIPIPLPSIPLSPF